MREYAILRMKVVLNADADQEGRIRNTYGSVRKEGLQTMIRTLFLQWLVLFLVLVLCFAVLGTAISTAISPITDAMQGLR